MADVKSLDDPNHRSLTFAARSGFHYTPGMLKHTVLLSLLASALAFAQSSPNSITVTASRTNNPQPDQVVFQGTVTSPLTTSRDDAIAALQGSGIGLANFSGVSTTQTYNGKQYVTSLQWNFTLTAPRLASVCTR